MYEWVTNDWSFETHSYMTNSCLQHGSFIHDRFMCATWLILRRDMTHSYVRHSFICATWGIHMCDTPSYVRHDAFICATWLIYTCDMIPSYVRRDTFICATWLRPLLPESCRRETLINVSLRQYDGTLSMVPNSYSMWRVRKHPNSKDSVGFVESQFD